MNLFFHILQWIVSLVAIGGLGYLTFFVVKAIVLMFWNERGGRYALIVFVAGYMLAESFQRLRIGFWDWPDVDYQTEVDKVKSRSGEKSV